MASNRAPLNDLELLRLLEAYPDKENSHTASTGLKRHLWYLSEDLVGLGFLDDRIPKDTKLKMVQRLQSPATKKGPKRLDPKNFNPQQPIELFVTLRTKEVFFRAILPESESPTFLKKDPGIGSMTKIGSHRKRG
ncbi:hypothetical protein GWK47_038878 [Chionoecetes opilio]|uniref:Uncharacterized protein n=1 Tax=Chionoecetes opilio TaxID=41210 RepID=A0A8J5CLW5_CHIOP|nr:hypothetical protein GWK47_038878 [Chionoecetes opilio]